jgi:hypothetical protein
MPRRSKIKYNKNHVVNDRFRNRKRDKRPKKKYVNTKGDWEAGWWQRLLIEGQEERIKKKMCPKLSFDPRKITNMINPVQSDIDKILEKKLSGQKLNTTENTKYDIFNRRSKNAISKDSDKLLKEGRSAKISTVEGATRKIILNIEHFLYTKVDYKNVYKFKLRLSKYNLSKELITEKYQLFSDIDDAIDTLDVHELQFMKYHGEMPPLNKRGFVKLDDFQIETVKAIDEGFDCIVSAPTSSGKSVLSGYLLTKNFRRVLIIVPTTPLAWQLDAYATEVYGDDIPIVTKTYKSIPRRDDLIDLISRRKGLVGTADSILDILPLLVKKNISFDAVIVDEIHMLGDSECSDMETIIKYLMGKQIKPQILCLSATIGNIEYLRDWIDKVSFNTTGVSNVKIIKCDKRFFNLQKFYYSINNRSTTGGITERISPLSMVNIEDFQTGDIFSKNLYPTPPDTWELYKSVTNIDLTLGENDPYVKFNKDHWITLDESNQLFNDLIKLLVNNIDNVRVIKLINDYKDKDFDKSEPRPVDIAFTLKKEGKCPCIFFIKDTTKCKRVAKQFSEDIIQMESEKYPLYHKDKMKKIKNNKAKEKKKDKIESSQKNYGHSFDKKKKKEMMKEKVDISKIDIEIDSISLNEPHPDFILNDFKKINEDIVNDWAKDLGSYFKKSGDSNHYVVDLLWRGVGVYASGLPDAYLRLVQSLASQGDLALVISDRQLVFGVSMPFRSAVIYDDDNLDPLWVKQMEGRAGRRGLDTEGCIVYAGFSWERIKELSVSPVPHIQNFDTRVYTLDHAINLSGDNDFDNIRINNFSTLVSDEESLELYDLYRSNLENEWNGLGIKVDQYPEITKFSSHNVYLNSLSNKDNAISNDQFTNLKKTQMEHYNFNYMMWRLRNYDFCYIISFLMPFIEKLFNDCNPKDSRNQVDFVHFILFYIFNDEIKEKIIDYHEKKIINYKITIYFNIWKWNCNSKLDNLNENSTEYRMLKSKFTTKITESKYILDVINKKVKDDEILKDYKLPEMKIFNEEPYNQINGILESNGLEVNEYCDRKLFLCIRENRIIQQETIKETDELRDRLLDFGEVIIIIQHYYRHCRKKTMTVLLAKLITRLLCIYNDSSPF